MQVFPKLHESTNDSRVNAEGQNYLRFLDTNPEYFLKFDEHGKATPLAERLTTAAFEKGNEFDHQIGNILLHAFSHMEPRGCSAYGQAFFRFSGGVTDILLCLESAQSVPQLKQINQKIVQGYTKHLEFDDGRGDSVDKAHGYYSEYLQLITIRKYIQNYNKSDELKGSFVGMESKLSKLQQQAFARFKNGYKEFYKGYVVNNSNEPLYDYLMPFESMSREFIQLFKQTTGFKQDQPTIDAAIARFLPNLDFEAIFEIARTNITPEGFSLTSVNTQNEIIEIRKSIVIFDKLKKILLSPINLPSTKK
jgi:hypothetical protein